MTCASSSPQRPRLVLASAYSAIYFTTEMLALRMRGALRHRFSIVEKLFVLTLARKLEAA